MNDKTGNNLTEAEERIRHSANDVRILFLFLLIAEVFILITISSTSDLQLLMRNDMYAIPFLGFSVDVVNFFIFAPLFVLFLTYNVNSSLFEHCKKLKELEADGAYSENITLNFINRIFSNERPLERTLIHLNISVLISFVPTFIQFYLLARFLDYQSILITLFHLSMVFATYFISFFYWLRISNPEFLNKKYDNINELKSILRSKIYFKTEAKQTKIIYLALGKSIFAIILFYLLTICLHPFIYEILGLDGKYTKIIFEPSKNLDTINNKIVKDYSDLVINILSLVTLSVICRKTLHLIASILFLFLLIEAPFFMLYTGHINNINHIFSYFDHIEITYFSLILLLLALKTHPVRKLLHNSLFGKKSTLLKDKFKSDEFQGIAIWQFIEISAIAIMLTSSIILTLFLCTLLLHGKFHSASLLFINDIYPKINVSEKQVFDLSKSSQLFEISHSNQLEYAQNMLSLNKCVSFSDEICHFIEPITINNRNLLFSNFKNSRMYQVRISNSDLSYSNFGHAHLEGSTIKFSDIIDADFSYATLQGSNLLNVELNKSKMKYTNISDSKITNSKLKELNMCHISFNNSKMYKSEFSCALTTLNNEDTNCRCDVSVYDLSPAIFQENHIANITIDFSDYIEDQDNRPIPVILFDRNRLLNSNNANTKINFNIDTKDTEKNELYAFIMEIFKNVEDRFEINKGKDIKDTFVYFPININKHDESISLSNQDTPYQIFIGSILNGDENNKKEKIDLRNYKPETHPYIMSMIFKYHSLNHDIPKQKNNESESKEPENTESHITKLYCAYYNTIKNNDIDRSLAIRDEYIKMINDNKTLEPQKKKSLIHNLSIPISKICSQKETE